MSDIADDRRRIALRLCVCASEMRDLEEQECEDIADGVAGLADQTWPTEEGVAEEIVVDIE